MNYRIGFWAIPLFMSFTLGQRVLASSGGPGNGGGGGGICLNGQCMTLAEAGVRVSSPMEPYYQITPPTASAVKDLLSKIPDLSNSYMEKSILGQGSTYIRLEVVDQKRLELLRKQYANLLKQIQSTIDPNKVVIFAYSNGPNTYLFPKFFELSLERQAKILIHELHIRQNGSLKEAVEFDGMEEDLLNDPNLPINPSFRIDRWYALNLEYSKVHGLKAGWRYPALWMARYYHVNNIIFDYAKFFFVQCSQPGNPSLINCGLPPNVDMNTVAENYRVDPAFMNELSNVVIWNWEFNWDTPITDSLNSDELKKICQTQLASRDWSNVLYPYREGVNFTLAVVECKKNGLGVTYVAHGLRITD
jgi:hypothetical protein